MAILTIDHADRVYTVATEDEIALTDRYWGLVRGRAIDELTGRPVIQGRAETETSGFIPRSVGDGMVGLVARPRDVYPKLAEQAYLVDFSVRAPGFIRYSETVSIPALPQFPIRTIDPATDPVPTDVTITLVSAAGIIPSDTLLVGRPGNREHATVLNVVPATGQVTFTTQLQKDHHGGDPVVVEAFAGFDPGVTVVDLGDVLMRRAPILVHGRVTRIVGGTVTPVAGAAVTVTAIRRRLEPAATAGAPEAPSVVSFQPPVYIARTSATGRLRRREMAEVLNEDKELLDWADAGADVIRTSDWFGLAVGSVVLVGEDPDTQEFASVSAIDPVGGNTLPARVTLSHRLAHRHRVGSRVRRVAPQPPGADHFFDADVIAGDTTAFMTNVAGLASVEVVEIFGGADPLGNPLPSEYHRLGFFAAQTGADGRYALPLMSRLAQLNIQASEGGDVDGPVEFVPDYGRRENRLDFQL